jgi:hypothetical protein
MDEEAEKFDPLNDPQNLTGKYILDDDGNVVPCCNLMEWAEWFEASYKNGKRRVGSTQRGDIRVSTVFLGLDHSFGGGPPLVFETMIFGGEHDEFMDRCFTWDEAVAMHREACKMAFGENYAEEAEPEDAQGHDARAEDAPPGTGPAAS